LSTLLLLLLPERATIRADVDLFQYRKVQKTIEKSYESLTHAVSKNYTKRLRVRRKDQVNENEHEKTQSRKEDKNRLKRSKSNGYCQNNTGIQCQCRLSTMG